MKNSQEPFTVRPYLVFRPKGERCLFQVKLWNTFYLNALICSSCFWVASWHVCQRFCWRVAYRQHHHCGVIELDCFLAFEEVSVVDVATVAECCRTMGSIKHLLGSHNCLYVWEWLYSFILTCDAHKTWVLFTYHELRNNWSTFYRTIHCNLKALGGVNAINVSQSV